MIKSGLFSKNALTCWLECTELCFSEPAQTTPKAPDRGGATAVKGPHHGVKWALKGPYW